MTELLVFFIAISLITLGFMALNQYNRMEEIAMEAKISQFKKLFGTTYAFCLGTYKNYKVSIQSFINYKFWERKNCKTIYQITHVCPFYADILPGAGLRDEEDKEKARIAKEESAKKVWNPNLSEDEKRIIEERRRQRETEDSSVSRDTLKISSAKPDEVNKYLDENNRRQLLCEMFKEGVQSMCVGRDSVSIVVIGHGPNEVKLMNCAKHLDDLKEFAIGVSKD
ncbi:hypothetical protein IJT93_08750 [bacterium]|nr:hypothetical protein [bacterium]